MTKRTYVYRDGQVVEKVRPEPVVFTALPFDGPMFGAALQARMDRHMEMLIGMIDRPWLRLDAPLVLQPGDQERIDAERDKQMKRLEDLRK